MAFLEAVAQLPMEIHFQTKAGNFPAKISKNLKIF
jgi:hypothetical protein